jgi:hypothetical protein
VTDQAPVSGGGWLAQEELSAGRMRADGGSLRMRRTTFAGAPAWLVARFPAGHAECEVIIDCPDTPIITPAETQKLGRALIAAADAAARLNRPSYVEREGNRPRRCLNI